MYIFHKDTLALGSYSPIQPCRSGVDWKPESHEQWYVPIMFTQRPFLHRLSLKEHSFISGEKGF